MIFFPNFFKTVGKTAESFNSLEHHTKIFFEIFGTRNYL